MLAIWTFFPWGRAYSSARSGGGAVSQGGSFDIHVSGGEYNVAANLADCFGLHTGIATAMVKYGIGELVQARVREAGVVPFYKWFEHDGVRGPNIATVYSDRGQGSVRPSFSTIGRTRRRLLKPGDFDWAKIFGRGVPLVSFGRHLRRAVEYHVGLILEGMRAAKAAGAVTSFDLNYREIVGVGWRAGAGPSGPEADRRQRRCAVRQ